MSEQNLFFPLSSGHFSSMNSFFFSLESFVFRLSQHSKNLFFDLGSATIQNLKYRDVWVLVGQKGIKGFSPYEEVCRDVLCPKTQEKAEILLEHSLLTLLLRFFFIKNSIDRLDFLRWIGQHIRSTDQ